jgi:hypothetical protein
MVSEKHAAKWCISHSDVLSGIIHWPQCLNDDCNTFWIKHVCTEVVRATKINLNTVAETGTGNDQAKQLIHIFVPCFFTPIDHLRFPSFF